MKIPAREKEGRTDKKYGRSKKMSVKMKGKYYITTAIAYTSAKPHIGNTYEAVLAVSIARFKRKDG